LTDIMRFRRLLLALALLTVGTEGFTPSPRRVKHPGTVPSAARTGTPYLFGREDVGDESDALELEWHRMRLESRAEMSTLTEESVDLDDEETWTAEVEILGARTAAADAIRRRAAGVRRHARLQLLGFGAVFLGAQWAASHGRMAPELALAAIALGFPLLSATTLLLSSPKAGSHTEECADSD
jgi:hypothetical protein